MDLSSASQKNTWIQRIFLLVLSFGLAFYLFAASISNGISPIDDHELVFHLRGQERLSLGQVVTLWQRNLQSTGRYRPIYNLLRPTELLIWGNHLNLWYVARVILFALSVFTCLLVLERVVGGMLSGILTLWFFTFAFWADIIGRLGPSESYGMFGLLLWVWGLYGLYNLKKSMHSVCWILLSLGCIVSNLSKENMMVIIIPTIGIYFLNRHKQDNRYLPLVPLVASFMSSFFVIRFLARLSSLTGVDVYGNSIGISRMGLFLDVLHHKTVLMVLIGALSFFWFSRHVPSTLWKRYFSHLWWTWVTTAALLVSQFVFYNGQWPTNIRYDYPGLFYKLLLAVSLLFLLKKIVIDRMDDYTRNVVLTVVSLCLLFGVWQRSQIWVLKSRVAAYHELTQSYSLGVQAIRNTSPTKDIILESSSINDLEIIHAIQVQLRQDKIPNRIFLRLHEKELSEANSLGLQLISSLQTTQNDGTDVITPLSKRDSNKECISIFLGTQIATECEASRVIAVTW